MLKGNKGEWSEIYVLLKLLGDKKLYRGDENLNNLKDSYLSILKVIREDKSDVKEYTIKDDFIYYRIKSKEFKININEFVKYSKILLSRIKNLDKNLKYPELDSFIKNLGCTQIKAKSNSKSDIKIIVHDSLINYESILSFSIKSQIGSSSTLLNSSKSTIFLYKILNINDLDLTTLNSKVKISERVKYIIENKGVVQFIKIPNKNFNNNLILVDSFLPSIIANLLLIYFEGKESKIKNLSDLLNDTNPLKYDNTTGHNYYEYKLKKFLVEIALGLMPNKVWTGEYDATGGYIVVKSNGAIVCYHIYYRNDFENYLFNNTKLETASTGRHDFGKIYKENSSFYLKLNLQIRFIT